MVARDVKSARSGEYLEDVSLTVNPIMPEPADEPRPNHSLFAILQPNESYDLEDTFDLHVNDEKVSPIGEGNYFLQLKVRTWYESRELAGTLSRRWRDIGTLWSKPLISAPMPFRVKSKH